MRIILNPDLRNRELVAALPVVGVDHHANRHRAALHIAREVLITLRLTIAAQLRYAIVRIGVDIKVAAGSHELEAPRSHAKRCAKPIRRVILHGAV